MHDKMHEHVFTIERIAHSHLRATADEKKAYNSPIKLAVTHWGPAIWLSVASILVESDVVRWFAWATACGGDSFGRDQIIARLAWANLIFAYENKYPARAVEDASSHQTRLRPFRHCLACSSGSWPTGAVTLILPVSIIRATYLHLSILFSVAPKRA